NWVIPSWGTQAVVAAGMGTKDHLRAALQTLSGEVPRKTIYRHLGWRQIEEEWLYLHAGGMIGRAGWAGWAGPSAVQPPEALALYVLPTPPVGADLVAAVQASLGLLHLGPGRIMFPLLAAPYRAAMGGSDFSKHLAGQTGN